MSAESTIIIRPDRVAMFEKRHPWVFSGAIQSIQGNPQDGAMIPARGPDGRFLARGYWNSRSQIRLHILSWDEAEAIDSGFWQRRLERAISARTSLARSGERTAYRLINAENDALPGLIVDRYADFLVLQALTLGIDQRKQEIAEMLMALLPDVRGVYERSDADVRVKEGLTEVTGLLRGEAPPDRILIAEYGVQLEVDIHTGHKTGFYLDQAENRRTVREIVAAERPASVLNCFSYTGGFSVGAALASESTVTWSVDSSADALDLARRNMAINGLNPDRHQYVCGDVFQILRQYRTDGQQFDMIILDPPKFAHNQGQIERACRGYKDINLLAFQLIRSGGWLVTFSCSGLIDSDLFQKVVFGALVDSKRQAQITQRLTAGPDHPVDLHFPEGAYLKGLVCRVW